MLVRRYVLGGIASGVNGGPLAFRCEKYGLVSPLALLHTCIKDRAYCSSRCTFIVFVTTRDPVPGAISMVDRPIPRVLVVTALE